MAMEFWGVEVKAGEPLKIRPDLYKYIHISQAALGEVKNVKGDATFIPLRLKMDNKDYIIGNLSTKDTPQMILGLVCEKQFELSHDWKNGSVYFFGYIDDNSTNDDEDFDSDEECGECPCGEDGVHEHGVPKKAKLEAKVKENESDDSDDSDDSGDDDDSSDGTEPSLMEEDSDFSDEEISSDDEPSKPVVEIPIVDKKPKLSVPEKKMKGDGVKKGEAGKKSNGIKDSSNNKSTGKKGKHGGK